MIVSRHQVQVKLKRAPNTQRMLWNKVRTISKVGRSTFYAHFLDKDERSIIIASPISGCCCDQHPVHLLRYHREKYGYRRGRFPNAERIGDSTVSLPLYPRLADEEVEHVIRQVRRFFGAD